MPSQRILTCLLVVQLSCATAEDRPTVSKTFGFPGLETITDAIVDPDRRVVVSGTTTSVNDQAELMVGVFAPDGVLQWMKALGGTQPDQAYSSVVVDNKSVVTAGFVSYQGHRIPWLARFSGDGVMQWRSELTALTNTELHAAMVMDNGDLLTVGRELFDLGRNELIALRNSSGGVLLWKKNYVSGSGLSLEGEAVCRTKSGQTVLAGTADNPIDLPNGRNLDMIFFGLDDSFAIQWRTQVDFGNKETLTSLLPVSDGGILGIGSIVVSSQYSQALLVKLNASGSIEWIHNGDLGEGNECHRALETGDGSFLVVGTHDRDVAVWKISSTGSLIWRSLFGGRDLERGRAILPIPRRRFRVVGIQYDGADSDILFLEMDENGKFISF